MQTKNKLRVISLVLSIILPVFLVGAVVFATTTLSANIVTEGDLTVGGDTTLGDATSDSTAIVGSTSFTQAAMTGNVKPVEIDATVTDATAGARQGGLYIGVSRSTAMTTSDGNPDCGLKMRVDNETASEDYVRQRGMDISVETSEAGSKSFFTEGISVTAKNYSGTEINDSGYIMAGKFITNMQGSGNPDVIGINIHDDSQATSGSLTFYGLKVDTANYNLTRDYALWVDSTNGSWTNGLSLNGAVTNVLDFENNDGTNGAKAGDATMDGDVADALIKIDIGGTAYYIPAFNAAGITGEW
jgi:hypothetical protein